MVLYLEAQQVGDSVLVKVEWLGLLKVGRTDIDLVAQLDQSKVVWKVES
jgi:hypothetical protein